MPKARVFDTLTVGDGEETSHGERVRAYFLHDCPDGWTCEVDEFADGVAAAVDRAIADGAKIIIWPKLGVWTYRAEWLRFHASGGIVASSHGSNEHGQYLDTPPGLVPYLVVVGGETLADGDPTDDRSYGPGLMLDTQAWDGETAESYAAPTVAAALAHLYDRLGDWGLAVSALLSLVSAGGEWAETTGYGLYVSGTDTSTAMPDVFPQWYLEGGESITLTNDGRALSWQESPYAGAYRIVRIGSVEEVIAEEGRGVTEYEDAEASPYETHGYRVDVLHAPSAETPLFASEWVYVQGLPNPAFRGVYPAEV